MRWKKYFGGKAEKPNLLDLREVEPIGYARQIRDVLYPYRQHRPRSAGQYGELSKITDG